MDNTEGIGSDDNTETVSGVGEDASKDRTEGETKEQEDKMKADEINLTVEQEEEPSHDSRCGLLKDRKLLRERLHSHKFQMFIIFLVGLDFLIVLVQLLIDIQVIRGVHHHHLAIKILHFTSVGLLGLFLIEIVVKLYAFGKLFFHHKLEVFDAIVVVVSFSLDVAYSGNSDAWDAVGLLVLLRLWRIVRIVNGIVLSVKIEMDEKIHHLKKEKAELQGQLEHYKNRCKEQEGKITELEMRVRCT